MRGSVIAFYRARWPTYDTLRSRQTLARETRAARQHLDRNSSKSVQHRVRALRPTPLEACSVPQYHVACDVRDTRCCARMTCAPHPSSHPTHAHTPSASQESRGRERALATIFSSTAVRTAESCLFDAHSSPRCRCPPRWSVEYDYRRRSLLGGTIYSTTRARASRPTTWSRHRHARMFLPLDNTPMRIQARPAPPAACDAGLVAAAFPHTVVQQHTAVTALRLRLSYSLAPPSPLPACAARATVLPHGPRRFIASSRAMCVSSKYHSARPWARRARPLHGTHDSPRAQHLLQPLPIAHAAVITSPPAANLSPPRYPPLEASSCPARGVPPKHAPSAHPPCRRRRPLEPSTCSLLRAPSPDPPCAAHAAAVPPIAHTLSASHVHPQCHTAPPDSAAHFPSPAPAPFAAMTRLRANSGPATRSYALPAPPLAPGSRYLRPHDGPVQGDSGREAALYAAPGILDRTAGHATGTCATPPPLFGALDSQRAPRNAGYRVNTEKCPFRTRTTLHLASFSTFSFITGYIYCHLHQRPP
ncbi:hypothetical protein B0H14DRAFT_840410 [Mycena olivaceomarginata]|nr:hypothetical protein B0H14DRAFT_840410 [Mycena olivaceomarginata]